MMGTTYLTHEQQIVQQLLRRKYFLVHGGGARELNPGEVAQLGIQTQQYAHVPIQQPQVVQSLAPQHAAPQYAVPTPPQRLPERPQPLGDIFYVSSIELAGPINVRKLPLIIPQVTPISAQSINVYRMTPQIPTPQLTFSPVASIILNEEALEAMGLSKNEFVLRLVSTASVIGRGLTTLQYLVGSGEFVDFLNGRLGPSSKKAVILLWDLHDNIHYDFIRELLLRRMRELGDEPEFVRSVIDSAGSVSNGVKTDLEVSSNVNQLLMIRCMLDKEQLMNLNWFKDRLRELMSRRGSTYVVIICERSATNVVGYVVNAWSEICKGEGAHSPIERLCNYVVDKLHVPFIILQPPATAEGIKLAYLINGVKPPDNPSNIFDVAFGDALMRYSSRLNEIKSDYELYVERGENESAEHFKLKAFIYHYLVKTRFNGKPEDSIGQIRTEYAVCSGVKADVAYGGEVYEVETLFGEGENSVKKVQETVMKYKGCGAISKVHIVLEPLTTVMHLKELWGLMEHFNNLRRRGLLPFGVSIETINVDREELVPLKDFIRELGEALS
ncbi:Competence CoiA family protein [Vulcanisaeta distributa DSM 14429]|uniref:Competence CoiA family protein n=2 Tax=Vulcanisaeta distributa TaxID=164451 RepID=E1QSR0_VULDI|nr:Competence CoiA family protein [Vulcanisaeta distributa DSM 14429]